MSTRTFPFLLAILPGCLASPAEESASSEAAATATSPGSYEVPVDASLAAHATNPVSVKMLPLPGGKFRLKYDLPEVIAGVGKEVDLVATETAPGQYTLAGTSGTGSCTTSATGTMTCQEHLTGVGVDFAQASSAVEALNRPAAETAARIAVAKEFSIDPLGVLRFTPKTGKGKQRGRDR